MDRYTISFEIETNADPSTILDNVQEMLPEIRSAIESYGDRCKFIDDGTVSVADA